MPKEFDDSRLVERRRAETILTSAEPRSSCETDAIPVERLTRCLVKMGKSEEAAKILDAFVEEFPQASDMTLLKAARDRVNRALPVCTGVQDARQERD